MCSEPLSTPESPSPSASSQLSLQGDKSSRIRVLLVDDHTMLREGLRSIVNGYNHLEVVGEASTGLEAIEAVRLLRPDVVVMDINMPMMNGIEATELIKEAFPKTSVIGLSVHGEMDYVQKMQAAGIHSYLTKESAVGTLCRAIEDAVSEKQ